MKLLPFGKKCSLPFGFGCLGALLFAALLGSCTQDPIFTMIAREVKPREPRIKGVPTKMAVFDDALYIGGTSLHRYAKNGDGTAVWDEKNIPQPPGTIVDLAASQDCLYVLINADSAALYRWKKGEEEWKHVPFEHADFPRLQTVYGALDSEGKPLSDYLFVGAGRRNVGSDDTMDYAVFCLAGGGGDLIPLLTETGLLTGAAFDGGGYYFSTKGDGIYQAGSIPSSASCSRITEKINAKGMVLVGNMVLGLSYGGDIFEINGSTAEMLNTNAGPYLRGSAAVWKGDQNDSGSLLLTAVIASDSTGPAYGYREIAIKTGPLAASTPGDIFFLEPGNGTAAAPSTMDDNNRYRDTIEAKPINSIFQVPYDVDSDMPVFASVQGTGTAQDDTDGGLWSLRKRDGILQWNAE
jgi:hypothetical protein